MSKHYIYRVHTIGGHVHNVYVPHASMSEFWVHILELSSKGTCLETFTITPNGSNIAISFLASAITVIDQPNGCKGIVLEDINEGLKVARTKNAVKKAKEDQKKREEVMKSNRKNAKKRTL